MYSEMRSKVDVAHASTSSVLGEASALMLQRRQAEAKQQLFRSLQTQFVLSENEVACLSMAAEPVDDRFFTTLAKAKKIVKDCEILLGFENQTLGHDILERASKTLDQAFQKLYKWIQREFRTLNLENPQFGARIRRALRVLAERPTLFHNCLDFFAEAREHLLSDSFYVALTGSSTSGREEPSVKPIELAAHDPLRYVGDMLAWTHSAAVSEREALEVLFVSEGGEIAKGIQAGRDHEIWRLVDSEEEPGEPAFDAIKALNDLVDRNVSGAARILRQRVEQVIQSNEEIILAYKLANLLNFYRVTFVKLLGDQSVLVESLSSLEAEALRQFRSLMRDYIAALQGDLQHTPTDLGSPDFLQEALEQLHAILKTYDTSLTSSASREADFLPILGEAFDPFIQGCHNIARDIGQPGSSIFLINCLLAAKAVLLPFDFTEGRVRALQDEIRQESQTLAESQYRFFREESGLDGILTETTSVTTSKEDLSRLKAIEALAPESMVRASQKLDDFLPSALMDALENMKQLQDSGLARQITEDAAERFCEEFEHLEEVLVAADEVKPAGMESTGANIDEQTTSWRSLFPRTGGEIRVLLS